MLFSLYIYLNAFFTNDNLMNFIYDIFIVFGYLFKYLPFRTAIGPFPELLSLYPCM